MRGRRLVGVEESTNALIAHYSLEGSGLLVRCPFLSHLIGGLLQVGQNRRLCLRQSNGRVAKGSQDGNRPALFVVHRQRTPRLVTDHANQ